MKFLSIFLIFLLGYVKSILNFKNSKFPKITGFFGLIGPNVDRTKTNSFFDLFMGDGIIYGVFIENGEITPVTHLVETEKILYEKKNNILLKNIMMMPLYMLLNKFNLLPNVMGVANTAFFDNDIPIYKDKKNILTTCEMDKPYEIELDFNKKDIKTLSKVNTTIEHFSAHSKYDKNNKKIHSIDYNPVTNKVTYYELDNICKNILFKNEFITKYSPNVHDFIIFDDNLIFIEPPLVWNFFKKIPLIFDKLKETYIIVYDLKMKKIEKYNYKDNGFFMFHYADIQKKDNILEIYAPLYDNFSFSSLEIDGKYRKIIINKITKKITIEKNDELEKMNLDFPIKWNDCVLLLKFNKKLIDELVLCKKLDIIKNIKLPKNRYLCGEPQIVEHNFIPYVIGILFDSEDNGYFFSFDMFNIDNSYVEKKLDYKPNIGFHSIFVYK